MFTLTAFTLSDPSGPEREGEVSSSPVTDADTTAM
jgi:hypothetical protein